MLLDAYLRDCLEEWCASGGQLSARSIVLLDDCARSITRRFRLLDGEGQYYFGQSRRLARRVWRGVDMEQAYERMMSYPSFFTFSSQARISGSCSS
ncbi:hypothetical protein [Ktedonobacter sp. SOSP1-52]|uniref:hypothetical protein n=1 Tax=Ktedonobacter sp. SOSP1-52 TaxID=2778366 RepID=UPI0019158E66|nr:hypothetical protein [Ktedonobacter sp. SOSP1-52]